MVINATVSKPGQFLYLTRKVTGSDRLGPQESPGHTAACINISLMKSPVDDPLANRADANPPLVLVTERCLVCMRLWSRFPEMHGLDMVVCAYHPGTWELGRGDVGIQEHLWLHMELEGSQGYMRPYLKTKLSQLPSKILLCSYDPRTS